MTQTAQRTRGHAFKLLIPRATKDVKKFSFPNRVIPVWNSLPEKVVDAGNIAKFKHMLESISFHYLLKGSGK